MSRQDGIGVGGVGEREPRRTGCAGLLERVWLRRRVRLGLDASGAGYGLRTLWRTTGAISIEGPVHNGGWASAGIDLRRDRLEVGLGLAAAGQEEDHSHNERTQVSGDTFIDYPSLNRYGRKQPGAQGRRMTEH